MSTSRLEFKDSTHLDNALPASKRIYVSGKLHPSVRVPLREITVSGDNAPVRVYDTRGPWGDPKFLCDPRQGLPAIRTPWIMERGDTVAIEGRAVRPEDNGYLSFQHANLATQGETRTRLESFPGLKRQPRRSATGRSVSQMY